MHQILLHIILLYYTHCSSLIAIDIEFLLEYQGKKYVLINIHATLLYFTMLDFPECTFISVQKKKNFYQYS